jgi:hypothetical protein
MTIRITEEGNSVSAPVKPCVVRLDNNWTVGLLGTEIEHTGHVIPEQGDVFGVDVHFLWIRVITAVFGP